MQNETNLWSIVLVRQNFKTDRYLNNFQEHLFEILRLRKYQKSLKISSPNENEAVKHDLVEFKVQCLKAFCHHGNNRFSEKKLPNKDDFYSILNDEHISDTQYVHAIKL